MFFTSVTFTPASVSVMLREKNAIANDMAKRFHNAALADAASAKAYVDAQWSEATVKQRYDWIFEYDATRVAV